MSPRLRRWLIIALGATLPIPSSLHLRGDIYNNVAIDIVIWPLLAGALVLASRRDLGRLRSDASAQLLVAFVIVSAISVPFGLLAYHSFAGPLSFVYEVMILSNFLVGYWVLRDVEDVELLLRAFVISLGVMALVIAGDLVLTGGLKNVHVIHNSLAIRLLIYGWPNGFSVLLDVGFVMCLYLVSYASSRLMRGAYILLTVGLGTCIVLTFSKTGWVALLVALWLLYMRFWSVRRQVVPVAVILAGIALLSAFNESFRKQVFTLDTLFERVRFLGVVLHDVNPLTLLVGSGSQNVETLLASHANEMFGVNVTVGSLGSHDEFLTVLVKTGVVGFALFIALLVVVLLRARRLAHTSEGRTSRLYRYWFASSCAIAISLFAGEELHYWLVGALFWMMAGAMVHRLRKAEVEPWNTRRGVKRAIDVVVAVLALVVTSPVLLVAALLIKLDSRGPVIYRGMRAGRGGRPFTMYKLRTMTVGAEGGGSVTVAGDVRVTNVGRALRRLKIDELPQLVNVVIGDMSLVGPRPDTPDYVKLYDERQRGVLRVRPGITSPASIAFHNEEELLIKAAAAGNRTPAEVYREEIMPKELDLDLDYVDNWSLARDVKVLGRTVKLVLSKLVGLPGDLRHPGRSGLPAAKAEVDQAPEKTDAVADVVTREGGRQDR